MIYIKRAIILPRQNKLGLVWFTNAGTKLNETEWHNLPESLSASASADKADEFAGYIKEIGGEKLDGAEITLCYSADVIPAVMFSYFPAKKNDVIKMRKTEMNSLFGEAADTMITDDLVLSGGKPLSGGKCKSIIFSMKKAQANGLYKAFKDNGLNLVRIAPFSVLFAESVNALWADRKGMINNGDGVQAAIYLGEYDSAIALFDGNQPLFVRSLDTCASELTDKVESYFKLGGREARDIIIKSGLDVNAGYNKDNSWLQESILMYFRELGSACARAVNSNVAGSLPALSRVLLCGEYSSINGIAPRLKEVLEADITVSDSLFKKLSGDKLFASDVSTAVSLTPYYTLISPVKGVNILNEIFEGKKDKKNSRATCAVIVAAAAVFMLVMPIAYLVQSVQLSALKESLDNQEYISAQTLLEENESAQQALDALKTNIEALPHSGSQSAGYVKRISKLCEQFGTLSSFSYTATGGITVDVVFSNYDDATAWRNLIDADEEFSFIGFPQVKRSGLTYVISAEIGIAQPETTTAQQAQTETTTAAETTTQQADGQEVLV